MIVLVALVDCRRCGVSWEGAWEVDADTIEDLDGPPVQGQECPGCGNSQEEEWPAWSFRTEAGLAQKSGSYHEATTRLATRQGHRPHPQLRGPQRGRGGAMPSVGGGAAGLLDGAALPVHDSGLVHSAIKCPGPAGSLAVDDASALPEGQGQGPAIVIREVEVRNYQSLRHLTVRLGRFTVLTGPSSTGKSSFLRAVRLLAFNARGSSFITRGEKQCSVAMSGDDPELARPDESYLRNRSWSATIQRGSKDAYLLTSAPELAQKSYTKLAGKVPDQVTQALRLGEVNFAGQFDPPYLLDASGGEVARVLGRLTNVTLLYKAAQEANRRRLQAASELKTRQADEAQLTEQKQQYATLPAEAEAVRQAEEAMARMQELSRYRSRLSSLMEAYVSAVNSLGRVSSVPELPSLGRLEELHAARQRLAALLRSAQGAMGAVDVLIKRERSMVSALHKAMIDLEQYQAQWGTCPLCGNPILKEHSHD